MSLAHYPEHLIGLLLIGVFPFVACYAMLFGGVLAPVPRPITTQRKRYFRLAVAFAVAVAYAYLTVGQYGFGECTGAIGEIQAQVAYIGWETRVVFFGLLAMPIFAVLAAVWVYLKPATYAKKTHGGYLYTSSVRAGKTHPVVDPYSREYI